MGDRQDTRRRVIDAAADILTRQGREAVTTRSVSAAAGVQPPTLYRLFGDMAGLFDAVAADGFDRYLAGKQAQVATGDPVQDLRAGWDLHVRFGLDNPAHYVLMYAPGASGGGGGEAAARAQEILRGLVGRVAEAGRLAVDAETAAEMIHTAGRGVVLRLIERGADDPRLSEAVREAVLAAVVTGPARAEGAGDTGVSAHANALRVLLSRGGAEGVLTPGEAALVDELLVRLASHRPPPA
ncbi:TetR/AcrR family transcriptional regulator [Nocardiopsis sp. NPDC057823]|uniref:TetR/AcrR family transcriptional regulator n=1 Tax=Nocardiopsis sp. NPDC057823 TaxID=3346256 RepID=UPI00366DB730